MDADPHGQWESTIEDQSEHEEHALLFVPADTGAPAAGMVFPPAASMSDPRKTCRSSAAAPTVAINSRSTAAARSAPCAAISASAPSKRRNATVAVRCSDG